MSYKSIYRMIATMVVASFLTFTGVSGVALAKSSKSLVDINTASESALMDVKGVGPATAKKIIASRPYASLDELTKAGLTAKKIESLKPMLTVGVAAVPASTRSTKKDTSPRAADKPVGGPVDLNTADKSTIEDLPGVGPSLAGSIIAARPFKSIDDLQKVKGVGPAKFAKLKDHVTVGSTAAPAAPAAAAPAATKPAAKGTSSSAANNKLAPGQVVNINTASKEQIESLPGIGPVKAQAIIDGRPYAKTEDIMKVRGIKQGIYHKIVDHITVQ